MKNTIDITNQGVNGILTPEIPLIPVSVTGVAQACISLNDRNGEGRWEFRKEPLEDIPALDAANRDYDFTALEKEEWAAVIVPGELEMQGFELKNNTESYYRTMVPVPEDFEGYRCMLRFDGVYSNARVWVNNHYVRSHQGGFTTWYCDITAHAVPGGELRLVVGIADLEGDCPGLYNGKERRSLRDPSFASNYAHHNIGGILRDVSLMALPEAYLARLHTNVAFCEDFDDGNPKIQSAVCEDLCENGQQQPAVVREGFRNARLQMGIQVNSDEHDVTVSYALLDEDGQQYLTKDILLSDDEYRKTDVSVLEAAEPKLWDAEHPYLYTLQITLAAGGQIQAVYQEKIGFREIWFAGKNGSDSNKVYVNGKQVKLRGTCRHDVNFRLGRSTTEEEDWAEIRAYKEANINHVRTSHYPASRYFLEACDALGMYVEQENAACFQGGCNGIPIRCAPEDFVGEFTEMVERDRNHASILMWSLGNESGFEDTEGYRREFDYIKAVDDSRPVIFSYPFTVFSLPRPYDIYSMHYMDVDAPMGLDDIPVLHDEYMHIACYNLEELRRDPNVSNFWGESIRKAWDRIFRTDGALGGDLWGGIDDIFHLPENVKEKWQNHSKGKAAGYGSWGSVLDVHKRLKPEAYLTKKAYTPVRIEEKDILIADGKMLIPVENRFDHTNLKELTLVCLGQGGCADGAGQDCAGEDGAGQNCAGEGSIQTVIDPAGRYRDNAPWNRIVYSGQIVEDIPPHSSGILQPQCPAPEAGEALRLQFYKGSELIDEYIVGNTFKAAEDSAYKNGKRTEDGIRANTVSTEINTAEIENNDIGITKKETLTKAETAADRTETAADKTGTAANKTGTADKTGTAADKAGIAADKTGTAADKAGIAANKTGTAADKTGIAAEKTETAVNKNEAAAQCAFLEAAYEETDRELIVTAGQSRFFFDKDTARMTMAQYGGKALLCGGPHLVLTGAVLGEWKKEGPGVQAVQRGSQVLVTLTGKYSEGYIVWYTITIDGDGKFVTSYQIKGGGTDKIIKECGIRYDLVPGAEKITWLRKGQYSCYPESHIGRNSGTAYRRNEKAAVCQYRTAPEWNWKEDMWDDFLYSRDDAENGLVTKDFKALRENIRYFDVHFSDSGQYVRVEDGNAQTAARVSVSVDQGGEERTALFAVKRWIYPELGWGNEEKRRFGVGAGTYGSVVMRLGEQQ